MKDNFHRVVVTQNSARPQPPLYGNSSKNPRRIVNAASILIPQETGGCSLATEENYTGDSDKYKKKRPLISRYGLGKESFEVQPHDLLSMVEAAEPSTSHSVGLPKRQGRCCRIGQIQAARCERCDSDHISVFYYANPLSAPYSVQPPGVAGNSVSRAPLVHKGEREIVG